MAPPLHPKIIEAMRKRAEAIKQRMDSSGSGFKRWDLSGKNALIAPGKELAARLLPRWDITSRWIRDPSGKTIENPDYDVEQPIYFWAVEHWWDTPDGKTTREWCQKTFDVTAPCPICEASDALRQSAAKEDRDAAKRIGRKNAVLFNAMIGPTGNRRFTEEGKPEIKFLAASDTIYNAIEQIMTGGTTPSFARGDISDYREGYDIKLMRPVGGGNDRWKVDCAPQSTPLFLPVEKDKYKGWTSQLINLEEMVAGEVKSYNDLFKLYHGIDLATAQDEEDSAAAKAGDPVGAEPDDLPGEGQPSVSNAPDDTDLLAGLDDEPPPPPPPAAKPRAAAPPKAAPPKAAPAGRRR